MPQPTSPHQQGQELSFETQEEAGPPSPGQLKGPSKEAGEHLGAGGGKAAAELRHHLPYLSLHRYISFATL